MASAACAVHDSGRSAIARRSASAARARIASRLLDRAEEDPGVHGASIGGDGGLERRRGLREVRLLEVEAAEREVGFGPAVDGRGATRRRDGLVDAIDALQQERQVVVGERVVGLPGDHLAQRPHRGVDVLFRLGQSEREEPLGVGGLRRHPALGPADRVRAPPGLRQGDDQVVHRPAEVGPMLQRALVGVDGGIQGADPFERLAEPVLDVGVGRRGSGRGPQQRQGGRVVAVRLERHRLVVGPPGGSGVLGRMARRRQRHDDGQHRRAGQSARASRRRGSYLPRSCATEPSTPCGIWTSAS